MNELDLQYGEWRPSILKMSDGLNRKINMYLFYKFYIAIQGFSFLRIT